MAGRHDLAVHLCNSETMPPDDLKRVTRMARARLLGASKSFEFAAHSGHGEIQHDFCHNSSRDCFRTALSQPELPRYSCWGSDSSAYVVLLQVTAFLGCFQH